MLVGKWLGLSCELGRLIITPNSTPDSNPGPNRVPAKPRPRTMPETYLLHTHDMHEMKIYLNLSVTRASRPTITEKFCIRLAASNM